LHTLEDMMSFGWSKEEGKSHIRAVKRHFRVTTPRARRSDSEGVGPQEALDTLQPAETP
jgi:hypothetical protein